LTVVLVGGAGSCAPRAAVPEPPAAWRLVDEEGPSGRRLFLEPDVPERPLLEIRILRAAASVGEGVEAEIRAVGLEGRRTVEVRPSRPGVRLLGPRRFVLEGERPVRVRFTSDEAGPGGIAVRLLE
jgi:hypothetical protein